MSAGVMEGIIIALAGVFIISAGALVWVIYAEYPPERGPMKAKSKGEWP